MESTKFNLPLKLPADKRKKLSLLIDERCQAKLVDNRESTDLNNYYYRGPKEPFEYAEKNEENFDSGGVFNETYSSSNNDFISSLRQSAPSDNNFSQSNLSSFNRISDSSFTYQTQLLSDESDDNDEDGENDGDRDYYIPCGLVLKSQAENKEEFLKIEKSEINESNENHVYFENEMNENESFESLFHLKKRALPRKMSKNEFKNSVKMKFSTPLNSSVQKSTTTVNQENDYYIIPTCDSKKYTLETFKKELFQDEMNKKCADCQMNDAKWVSGYYLITLCDLCAEIHQKIPHQATTCYIISIESLFKELSTEVGSKKYCSIESFLDLMNRAGNDNMNSLFEFNSAKSPTRMMDKFIQEKYLHKSFINRSEIDYSTNYVKELNKILHLNVKGPCLPITIYNIYLGANMNSIRGGQTLFDMALEANQETQVNYLKLNSAFSYNKIDQSMLDYIFEGEISQVHGANPVTSPNDHLTKETILIRLDQSNFTMQNFNSNTLTKNCIRIQYSSIIKIYSHFKRGLIEVKWCNEANNSLVSSYFEYSKINENKIWMKEFFKKLFSSFYKLSFFNTNEQPNLKSNFSYLFDLVDCCQISMIGFLHLVNSSYDANNKEQVFLILLESLAIQRRDFFKKCLILVKKVDTENTENFYEIIDLRKAHLKYDQNLLKLDLKQKSYLLKSTGYVQNLDTWYESLKQASIMNFLTIEDQYLTKESIPIYIEKLCSFVEFNLIKENDLYNGLVNNNNKVNGFKCSAIARKLLEDKTYELSIDEPGVSVILALFKEFFQKFFEAKHLTFFLRAFSDLFDVNNFQNCLIEQLTNASQTFLHTIQSVTLNLDKLDTLIQKLQKLYPTFYFTLKRLFIHMKLVALFNKNLTVVSLCELFAECFFTLKHFLHSDKHFHNELSSLKEKFHISLDSDNSYRVFLCKILECSVINCVRLFHLKGEYMSQQEKMIEKSAEMRNSLVRQCSPNNKNILLTIYLEEKKSGKSFQLNADLSLRCRDVLATCVQVFKLDESKNWSLFEIFDYEQHKLMSSILLANSPTNPQQQQQQKQKTSLFLERSLSDNVKILDSLSTWSSFYICVKQAQIDAEKPIDPSLMNECKIMLYCENCGYFKADSVSLANRACNSMLHKKWGNFYFSASKDTMKIYKKFFTSVSDFSKFKPNYELKLDSCFVYYGCYIQSVFGAHSELNNENNEAGNDLNLNECFTVYDKRFKCIFCFNLGSNRERALEFYACLNKISHAQNSLDVNEERNASTEALSNNNNGNNNSNSPISIGKIIGRIFRK